MNESLKLPIHQRVRFASQTRRQCPVCEGSNLQVFADFGPIPLQADMLWRQKDDAQGVPGSETRLAYCCDCTHVFNLAFNNDLFQYANWYGQSIHQDSRFCKGGRLVVDRLIERYELQNKFILELGNGCSEYAQLFSEIGENSSEIVSINTTADQLERATVFPLKNFPNSKQCFMNQTADLFICQDFLEKTDRPVKFLRNLANLVPISDQTIFYFEFADARKFFEEKLFWDVDYRQCSYFNPYSASVLLTQNGFTIIGAHSLDDGNGFSIEAVISQNSSGPANVEPPASEVVFNMLENFNTRSQQKLEFANQRIIENSQKRVVSAMIWCDPRSIRLLNLFNHNNLIPIVIDPRFENQGLFIPGTGQRIRSLSAYFAINPGTLFLANPSIEMDIRELFTGLTLTTELIVL